MEEILQIRSVGKDFGGLRALSDIDIRIYDSQITGLIGPNGSGKTTLFNLVTGFIRPTRGQIIWQGTDITKASPYKIASLGVVRTFQEAKLFFGMSVLHNVVVAEVVSSKDHRGKRELINRAVDIIEFAGLKDIQTRLAADITFGQSRKLGIAIALGAKPKLLMVDEPFGGLNVEEIQELIILFRKIYQQGIVVWIIDHRVPFLAQLCDRLIVLDSGMKIAEGLPKEILNNEKVIEVYLGKKFARTT